MSNKPPRNQRGPRPLHESYADIPGRENQSDIISRIIDTKPEDARRFAANWAEFVADQPDAKDMVMTPEGLAAWKAAHPEVKRLPSLHILMRDRDFAETLAADERRAVKETEARAKKEAANLKGRFIGAVNAELKALVSNGTLTREEAAQRRADAAVVTDVSEAPEQDASSFVYEPLLRHGPFKPIPLRKPVPEQPYQAPIPTEAVQPEVGENSSLNTTATTAPEPEPDPDPGAVLIPRNDEPPTPTAPIGRAEPALAQESTNPEHWEKNHRRTNEYAHQVNKATLEQLKNEGYDDSPQEPSIPPEPAPPEPEPTTGNREPAPPIQAAEPEMIAPVAPPQPAVKFVPKARHTPLPESPHRQAVSVDDGLAALTYRVKRREARDLDRADREWRHLDQEDSGEKDSFDLPPDAGPEDRPDTRKGWFSKLRNTVEKFAEFYGAKETAAAKHFAERSAELDRQAKGLGPNVAAYIRGYNKLDWKKKFAIGVLLAGGAAATAGVSATLSGAFMAGIWTQRGIAFLGMIDRIGTDLVERKHSGESISVRQMDKEFATRMAMAAFMSGGMGMAIKETVGALHESGVLDGAIDRAHDYVDNKYDFFLRKFYPLGEQPVAGPQEASSVDASSSTSTSFNETTTTTPLAEATATTLPEAPVEPALDQYVMSAHANPEVPIETAAPMYAEDAAGNANAEVYPENAGAAPVADIPEVSVAARAGRGYEDMAWRLWDELKDKKLDPKAYYDPTLPAEEQSDLYKLLTADKGSIKGLVHKLADERGFYIEGTGKSVLIQPDAKLAFNAEGKLAFTDAKQGGWIVEAADKVDRKFTTEVADAPEAAKVAAEPLAPKSVTAETPEITSSTENTPKLPEPASRAPLSVEEFNDTLDKTTEPGTDFQDAAALEKTATIDVPVNMRETHGYLSPEGRLYVLGDNKELVDMQAQDYALKKKTSVFVDKSYKLLGVIHTPRFVEYVPNPDGTLSQVIHHGPAYEPDLKKFTKRVF